MARLISNEEAGCELAFADVFSFTAERDTDEKKFSEFNALTVNTIPNPDTTTALATGAYTLKRDNRSLRVTSRTPWTMAMPIAINTNASPMRSRGVCFGRRTVAGLSDKIFFHTQQPVFAGAANHFEKIVH